MNSTRVQVSGLGWIAQVSIDLECKTGLVSYLSVVLPTLSSEDSSSSMVMTSRLLDILREVVSGVASGTVVETSGREVDGRRVVFCGSGKWCVWCLD